MLPLKDDVILMGIWCLLVKKMFIAKNAVGTILLTWASSCRIVRFGAFFLSTSLRLCQMQAVGSLGAGIFWKTRFRQRASSLPWGCLRCCLYQANYRLQLKNYT